MAPPPKKEKKVNKGKPPPIDKLIVPAIGLAIGIVAFQFIKGIISADVSGRRRDLRKRSYTIILMSFHFFFVSIVDTTN